MTSVADGYEEARLLFKNKLIFHGQSPQEFTTKNIFIVIVQLHFEAKQEISLSIDIISNCVKYLCLNEDWGYLTPIFILKT